MGMVDVRYYPVIIEYGQNDAGEVGFSAFFPDLPGCVSGGDSCQVGEGEYRHGGNLVVSHRCNGQRTRDDSIWFLGRSSEKNGRVNLIYLTEILEKKLVSP
ncbi:hypothetical protein WCLP8_3490007 [uncultured Gammaproteobacteria bacterium]